MLHAIRCLDGKEVSFGVEDTRMPNGPTFILQICSPAIALTASRLTPKQFADFLDEGRRFLDANT